MRAPLVLGRSVAGLQRIEPLEILFSEEAPSLSAAGQEPPGGDGLLRPACPQDHLGALQRCVVSSIRHRQVDEGGVGIGQRQADLGVVHGVDAGHGRATAHELTHVDVLGSDATREGRAHLGSLEFAKRLIKEAEVAVSPGVGFGEHGEGYVRIALVENEQRIRQAARNVKRFLASNGAGRPADAAE